jgi:dCTP diphosphatase
MSDNTKSDNKTTVAELKNLVHAFTTERDWLQFHSPKNMSMMIAAEAAELMEIFMWIDTDKSVEELEKKRTHVEQEVADIAVGILMLCAERNIDLSKAIEAKMALNAKKYPVEKAKGNSKKYTEL